MNKVELGRLGESFSAALLEKEGYKVISRNYRCEHGEIDLICEENHEGRRSLIFVEVKTRRTDKLGRPAEAVNKEKIRHIKKTAISYLKSQNIFYDDFSFQVIEVYVNQIKNAF